MVVGAGAIGILLGGFLAHGGHQTAFVEPAVFAQKLKEQGLTLDNEQHTFSVTGVPVYRTPEEIPEETYQLLILAVKAYDMIPALNAILPHKEKFEHVMVPQNGLGNEEKVSAFFRSEKIISAALTIPVSVTSPGEIKLAKKGGLGLAGFSSPAYLNQVSQAFRDGGLFTRTYRDWQPMKWSKLLLNIMGNATSAILAISPGEVFSHPRMVEIEKAAFNEGVTVMKAKRIARVNLPGYSLKLLENLFALLPAEILVHLMQKPMSKSRGSKMPSLYLDTQGKKSEIGVLNGGIVQAGKELGIPTPANLTLTQVLEGIMNGELRREEFKNQPQQLWREYIKRKGVS